MKILIIGGTGMTGRHIVRELAGLGHEVTVFHRGRHALALPLGVGEVLGDKGDLWSRRQEIGRLTLDLVLHMSTVTKADAYEFTRTFGGMVGRAVAISSGDVYRAYGRLRGTEPGPPEPLPLTEDSPLRESLGPEGEAYDKTGVEAILRSQTDLSCTLIRYPAVFGPHDGQRRFHEYFQRIRDNREAILIGDSAVGFRFTHAYSENAAHAVVLAATSDMATGRTYNVGELETPRELERLQQIVAALSWRGRIVVVPDNELPEHLQRPAIDQRQNLVMDDARIREELGYSEVVDAGEGIRRSYEWAASQVMDTTRDYAEEDAVLARY